MSRVTDRLNKENIIEIAKQEYDVSQKSTLPSEIIKLASGGKIYPTKHPLSSGTIEMRYMTAYDEDILTNKSYIDQGIMLDKLIDNLIVTPNITSNDLASVDKDGLIIQSRILAYGAEYPVTISDPKTGKILERVVNLNSLKYRDFNLQCDDIGEFSYDINKDLTIKFNFISNKTAKTIKENNPISDLLFNMITQVRDKRDEETIKNFIRYEFLARDAKQFRGYIQDNTPGLILETEFVGEDGSTFTAGFPVGADLFWF